MENGAIRELSDDLKLQLGEAFKKGKKDEIIEILLNKVDLFPIKDSYIAFLRNSPSSLKSNPATVKRIGSRLLKMGLDEVLKASAQPKETNRQIGPLFNRWVHSLGYSVLNEAGFLASKKGIVILEGSDKSLKDFSNKFLKTRLSKGLDIVLKVDNRFIIGEAKFLTDFGGHQNAQFNDAMNLIRHKGGIATRIAILDGVVWLQRKNKLHTAVKAGNGIALSATLLKDFIECFNKPRRK